MSVALLLGYFLGSLPIAYWFGALRGRNLLQEGSGNPGALNAYRVLGPVPGFMVLLQDVMEFYLGKEEVGFRQAKRYRRRKRWV